MSTIYIKKSNKGKFTSYCGGKVTEDCIQKGKNSPSAKIRKQATFAANARKWNKKGGKVVEYNNKFIISDSSKDRIQQRRIRKASGGMVFYDHINSDIHSDNPYYTEDPLSYLKPVQETDVYTSVNSPVIPNNTENDAAQWSNWFNEDLTSTNPGTSTSTTYTKTGSGSRGVRNNNWFNIRGSKKYTWNGESGRDDKDFVVFDNAESGVRAARKNLDNYFKAGQNTIDKIIRKWSPVADPGNSANGVSNYVDFVAKTAGIDKNTIIDPNDDELMSKILYGMAIFENGQKNASNINIDVIKRGIQAAKA